MSPLDELIRERVRAELIEILPDILQELNVSGAADYVSTEEAARITGMSVSWFQSGRSQGWANMPPHHRIGRRVLYSRRELQEWMAQKREAPRKTWRAR
jgi:predicted DNA-binding transcriptional regulator AlpA